MSSWIPLYAQNLSDEGMRKWAAKFSHLSQLVVNGDGSFAMVSKSSVTNADTVFVFSPERSIPSDTLVGYNISRSFLKDKYVFAHGINKAVLSNLKTGKKLDYVSVRSAGVIRDKGQYFLVDRNKALVVYDVSGSVLYRAEGVEKVLGDHNKILFSKSEVDGGFSIVRWQGKKADVVYSTGLRFDRIELLPSGNYLSIRGRNGGSGLMSVKILNCSTGKLFVADELEGLSEKTVKISEVGNGESFLITAETHIPPAQTGMVKLWYGSDKELRFTRNGKTKYRSWYLKADSGAVTELPSDKFDVYAALNNSRYLWAFSYREAFNYVYMSPGYDMYLYDTVTHEYKLVFPASSEVFGSEDGRYAVSYSRKDKVWLVYDIDDRKMNRIIGTDLKMPVYSSDHKSLFFSGPSDLYVYNLKTGALKGMSVSEHQEVLVMDKVVRIGFNHLETKFNTVTVDDRNSLRLQLYDPLKSTNSVVEFRNGRKVFIVPETVNKIQQIVSTNNRKKSFSIEESFNLPDGLYCTEAGGNGKKILYQSNLQDKLASGLKVDVVHFKNFVGKSLKGLLTYPINYEPERKYPMVVQVYQRQSKSSANYLMGEISEDGFSKRLLLEHGYFVYQPDVVFDERGTGVSALDCVHSALDAVALNRSIDFTKVGLTGHSMGGYETNFIATQSNRFAAYISGSSVSNVVQNYFSYNKLFENPDFGRYENGQFEMPASYVENSDLYFNNNPINFVQKVSAPMLLWAGSKDDNAVPEQTEAFYIGLLRNRKPVISMYYTNQAHSLGYLTPETFDLNRRSIEWWDYFLKDKKDVEWVDKEMVNYK